MPPRGVKPPIHRTDTPGALAEGYASVPSGAPNPAPERWLWPLGVLVLLAAAVVAESVRSTEDAPWLLAGLGLGAVLVGGLSVALTGVAWARRFGAAFAFLLVVTAATVLAVWLAGPEHASRVLRLAGVIGIVCIAFPGNPAVQARTLRLGAALLLLALITAGDLFSNNAFLQAGLGLVAVLAMVALRDVFRAESFDPNRETIVASAVPAVGAVDIAPVREPDLPPPGEPSYAELKRELARHEALERQLLTAKQEAEAAMMAKGEFLATMSHEIRTPLNGIIPLLDIVLSTQLAADQRDYIVTAYQSAKQLLSIVDDILDFSKIEAHKLELESVGLNIKELTDAVTRLLGKNAEAKGLRLAVNIDPNVRLAMRGDPTRLRQILTNLVSNAIKFTDRGTIAIEVKKRGDTRSHSEILFTVTDSGAGISAENQARLFKPFTQADASTTRLHGGTGLGLVICKRIVDLMGGQIGVKSEPGKGSSFWFSVPLLKAMGDVAPSRTDVRGARALVVSTDQALIRRLSGFFTSWGVQFVQTSVSAEALAKLRSAASMGETWTYDFLVLDWGAMKNTALSLARNVMRDTALDRLRIVSIVGEEEIPTDVRASPHMVVFGRQFGDVEMRAGMQRLLDIKTGETPTSVAPVEEFLPELKPARLRPPEEMARIAPQPAVAGHTPTMASGGVGGHVLLVEDNAVNRQVAQRLLSLAGVSFDIAEHGKQALERLEHGNYDAVLMDCMMPILDGYAAVRAIRRLEADGARVGRIPVIAMTANAMAGDREKCLAAGMDDYMSKPLNRALIEQMLRKWLPAGARKSHAPASVAQPPVSPVVAAAAPVAPAPLAPRAAPPPAPAMGARAAAAYVAPAAREGSAINAEIIQDLLEMMGGEFTELVRVYLEDTPKSLALLERAAQNGDADALIAPSHSLKSTSANLGALGLSEMAKKIEHGARQGSLSAAPVMLVAEISAEYQRVSGELKRLLASAPA